MDKKITYCIDGIQKKKNQMEVSGWAFSPDATKKINYSVVNQNGKIIDFDLKRISRVDVIGQYSVENDIECGFLLKFPITEGNIYTIIFSDGERSKQIVLSNSYMIAKKWGHHLKEKLYPLKIKWNESHRLSYAQWYKKVSPSKAELQEQKNISFDDKTKFSIVIPLYKTKDLFLHQLVDSICDQTYSNYEVCFADASPAGLGLQQKIEKYTKCDKRFKYWHLSENKTISENTNEALKMTTGDFILFCDHDDLLTPDALFEFAKMIHENPDCDCIYSDEDKVDESGHLLSEPYFKPDYSIDLLTSNNYICHLFGVRHSMIEEYGNFDPEYNGSQDYDFILRMCEKARKVCHIPHILYHWRKSQNSTSENPESKLYAYEAGAKAIKAHYERVWPQFPVDKVETTECYGTYHTYFSFEEHPLISVIIPNMDHTNDLDQAIRSLLKDPWSNIEIIVVENNSKEATTEQYYQKIQNEFSNVHVIRYKGSFNYSKINNFGTKFAHGQYYLFMNNDVEMIYNRSVEEMMGYAQRDDVGIVGCRLLYPDNTIQHAGVIIGISGIADHAFRGRISEQTYFNQAMTVHDLSAVTAAVMLVKKEVFEKVNGFDERFAVAFNDVDFCLKVRKINQLVVYNPYACFYHYESKSRGYEDTPEKKTRFAQEVQRFTEKWQPILVKGDPYYNTNLTLRTNQYELRNLYYEKPGDPYYGKGLRDDLLHKTPEEIANIDD